VHRLALALTLAASAGCATKQVAPPAAQPVDLKPARDALELAREAGADERAPDSFGRAQGHLNEAEALAADVASHDSRRQSEWLGRLATVEAQCATQIARQQDQQSDQRSLSTQQEVEKRNEKIRRHEDDQRRLEEQLALLKRELDFTETEMIRTKARLKGIETKAEASSAIAEGRILLGRMIEEKGTRSQDVQRAQAALQRAENLLREENFGAAIFFAQKAQDAATKAREQRSAQNATERPAPNASYTVKAPSANLRKGPGTTEAVVARVVKGTRLKASVMRGDWIRVEHAGATGWVHRSLVE
jgi:hypothetical protein